MLPFLASDAPAHTHRRHFRSNSRRRSRESAHSHAVLSFHGLSPGGKTTVSLSGSRDKTINIIIFTDFDRVTITDLTYSTKYLMLWIDQAWSEERRCWDTVRITIVRVCYST